MTDPAYEERELRSALGTLLADEPAPSWVVADDVARGRSYVARRRARLGGGIALVAVLALVSGMIGPWRVSDRSNPPPAGGASHGSVISPSPTPSAWRPSPDPSYKDGIAYVTQGEWGAAVGGQLPGTVTEIDPVLPSGPGVLRGFRIVRDGVGTYVRVLALVYTGDTPVLSPPAAQDPCASFRLGCTVLRPWSSTASAHGAPAGVVSVVQREGAGASSATAYAGHYTIRTVLLQRGSTELWIESDSRDVDRSGRFTSSSAPGLTANELVALATTVPLPIRFVGAVDEPWAVPGSGSASAVAGSG